MQKKSIGKQENLSASVLLIKPGKKPSQKIPRKRSAIEELLLFQIKSLKITEPVEEFRFHVERRWRFDFAWPELKFAVEVEGGAWVGGRHGTGAGFTADLEKYHYAMADGWSVYRCGPELVKSGMAVDLIKKFLEIRRK